MISEKLSELLDKYIDEIRLTEQRSPRSTVESFSKAELELYEVLALLESENARLERQLHEMREGIDPKERKPDYGVVVHAHVDNGYYDRVFRKDDFPHLDEWHSDTRPCVTYATIDRWWHLPEVQE